MVWFQCESCGENLKKPKLQNHFHGCAARKLSCIDCGVVFDQQSVQVHTSCVSETEKYGPKVGSNSSAQKPNGSQVLKGGDVDLSIGLSTNPPWNCSLCKINATSFETLEGHSQGKKHRAKAKAAQAKLNSLTVTVQDFTSPSLQEDDSAFKVASQTIGSELVENGESLPTSEREDQNSKKRKIGLAIVDGEKKLGEKLKKSGKSGELIDSAVGEGLVSFEDGCGDKSGVEESATGIAHNGKAIKWKKLTTKVLVKAPEKSMKIKLLLKELLPLLGADNLGKKTLEKQLVETLNSSSKFQVNGRWVALAQTS